MGNKAADKTVKSDHETQRTLEREQEDDRYVPVIIKRTDEALRHPDDILEHAIAEGLEQLKRPNFSLLLSSIAAGLILGFSVMAVAFMATLTIPLDNELLTRLAMACVYPLGFVLCIMSGAQLFTEHTATAVYPVLDRRIKIGKLLRLWCFVVIGNLIGAYCSAGLLVAANNVIQAKAGYLFIAEHLVHFDIVSLLVSALLAGWLMALGAWLILATPPTITQIACVYIVTFLIGIGGLHHSIAGAVEIFAAFFISDVYSIKQVLRFIGIALAGNLIGGTLFVAMLNYGHIRQSQLAKT